MKQVKMDLNDELRNFEQKAENCKKQRKLNAACKILLMASGGIGCFILGGKYTKACIDRGLCIIYSNYPDAEKAMSESLVDYCTKNNLSLKLQKKGS